MIELQDLHKSFGAKQVLSGVNLTIREGETIVVIGRSGTGKSVLLKHIIGLMEPDTGKVLVRGQDVFASEERNQTQYLMSIGMLFQAGALFDSLNVLGNVGFSLYEHTNLPEKEIEARVREKLALVGLEGIEDLMPAELSGGMRKRVALARAICHEPKIILYDEPTTGLDPINSDVINELILRMQSRLKVTSIVVTHDMTSAYKVANRIAMLYNGNIIAVGTPEEIKNTKDPLVRQFITGSARGPMTDH